MRDFNRFATTIAPAPPRDSSAGRRGKTLYEGGRLNARLSWYPPGLRMARHAHGRHQLSLLLSGTLGETASNGEVRLDTPSIGLKPAGVWHANDYGPHGALILAVDLDGRMRLDRDIGLPPAWRWRQHASPALLDRCRRLLRDLLDGQERDPEGRVWELIAGMVQGGEDRRGTPPRWVERARARLGEEGAPLAALASAEGLSPVYFSRAFLQWTGWRPSEFRARARFQRALAALADGHSLASAAAQAGYADQAHFSRAARSQCGLSPQQLRGWVARAT